MGVRVDADQVNIYAERTVVQYSMCRVSDLLEYGQTPEDYFEDNWDDEDEQDMEYYIEVDGVVPQSDYSKMIEAKSKLIKELREKLEAVEQGKGKSKLEEKIDAVREERDKKVEEPRL